MSELTNLTCITKNYYHYGQDLKSYAKSDLEMENLLNIPERLNFVNKNPHLKLNILSDF
jgi:hypothetical protein